MVLSCGPRLWLVVLVVCNYDRPKLGFRFRLGFEKNSNCSDSKLIQKSGVIKFQKILLKVIALL